MNYRFYITLGSSRVEVFPQNFLKTTLVDERGEGEIFYRRKFNGTLRFYCNTKIGTSDFDLLYYTEELTVAGVIGCQDIILEIEQKDSGANTYHNYWTGHFTTSDGKWDLDNSTFDVTPKPYDNYTNFDIYGDEEYNIIADLAANIVTTNTLYPAEDYKQNLFIVDVIDYLLKKIEPGATITSWFLNNEYNPVLTGLNQYRYLTIAQKSDIKRPNDANPATIGMMSFNEIMSIISTMYNLYWTYNGSVLRIEHYDFWSSVDGLDLQTQSLSFKSNKYSYAKSSMPKYEKFNFMEAIDNGYIQHTISYDSPCVDPQMVTEVTLNVTTDLSYIMRDPDSISDAGWVILANQYDGSDYYVYYGVGLGSGEGTYNYPNSWGELLRSFYMHDRVLMSGFIQGASYDFISAKKTKQQEIKAVVCYEDNYDPNDNITTELGEVYFNGQKGSVRQADIYPDGHINFSLLYGENKNTDVVLPTRTKNIHIIIDHPSDSEVVVLLSEPNVVDTYFWVYWNNTTCQQIKIPAGDVFFSVANAEVNPIVDIKFYYSHASTSGWVFTYNDGEGMTAIASPPCPGAPPIPPVIPPAAAMVGVGQFSMCGKLTITWNSSVGATYYKLYRNPDNSLNNNWIFIDNVMGTTYDDYWPGTQDGIEFSYKVKACNDAGCSADSNVKSTIALC